MARKLKTVVAMAGLLSLLWLSACSSQTPTATPTLDLNPFRTEVAATVFAQVTRDLALTPSPTPIPSFTPTSPPSATPTQAAATASPGPVVSLTPGTPGTPGVSTTDLAEWVSQSIADDTVFAPGETFTITWRLRNTGTSTWTEGYLLRFYSGNNFGAPNEVVLGRVVLPGETVDISVAMKAPNAAGNYRTDWVMSNESRSNFKQPVFLRIVVALPPTPTPAPTSTAAPTATP